MRHAAVTIPVHEAERAASHARIGLAMRRPGDKIVVRELLGGDGAILAHTVQDLCGGMGH